MKAYKPSELYRLQTLLYLIPIVGIALSLLFCFNEHNVEQYAYIIILLQTLFITTGLWFGCYSIVTFLWIVFPWETKPIRHVVIELVAILVYTNTFAYITYKILVSIGFVAQKNPQIDFFSDVVFTNIITLFITLIHEAVYFYRQWKYNFSRTKELEKENIQAKYEALKNHIQPHFLFNSLNTLSSIISGNQRAETYIHNLADVLRYVLQNKDSELVSCAYELDVTEKYIEIQKERFGDNLQVQIDQENMPKHALLPPLVLQSLVENCIKHNIISKEKPLTISIQIHEEYIVVVNNLQKRLHTESIGHGLQSIIRRYEYLTNEPVTIIEDNTIFSVQIPLLQSYDTGSYN